jgi:hypothetical protein
MINKLLLKLLMSILLLLQKILKDKSKKNHIARNDDDNNSIDNHTHFMEKSCNKPYSSMELKCIEVRKK